MARDTEHQPLDPRPYDTIWEADGRRQDAQRGRNDRYPDHSAGSAPARRRWSAWVLAFVLGAIVLGLAIGASL